MTIKKAIKKKATPRTGVRRTRSSLQAPKALPDHVDPKTIERLAEEAERGIPVDKLRRRGRPSIGADASSTYSVRLPDELIALADERSAMDGVTRGETVRRALIDYLTK